MQVPRQIYGSLAIPVQRAFCDVGRMFREKQFYPTSNKITRFEGVAFFLLVRFIITNTLKNVELMRVPGPIRLLSVMPVQRALCDAGRMFRE